MDINSLIICELNNTIRSDIHPGSNVDIVLKKDQKTGILTRGTVKDILTNKKHHPRGIKVRLNDNQVGRVQHIIDNNDNKIKFNLNDLDVYLFNDLFKNIPFCLILPDKLYYQNTKPPEPAVQNIINYIFSNNYDEQFKDIQTIKNYLLINNNLNINTIRNKINILGNILKSHHISFFIISKGASMISNNNNILIRKIREEQIRWEKKNHFDPNLDWSSE